MRLVLIATLLLTACASAPKQTVTVTVTKANGETYVTEPQKIADPRTHANGSRMDWVELAVVKVHGGLPPPPKPMPVWSCMAADLGTTGVGIGAFGLVEANPLGLAVAVPIGVGTAIWAKRLEKRGDPYPAKLFSIAHCAAAVWNVAMILLVLASMRPQRIAAEDSHTP
jgi:hypothetical protein